MRTLFFFICLLLSATFAVAATDSIIVKKDARLDVLTAKQASINKLTAHMTSTGQYKGFRLQLLTTRNREEAFQLKSSLLQKYPEQKAYELFQSPYFKVRFGNFIDRAEAEKYRIMLSKNYTQGVYIIEDGIEYTPTKEGEEPINNEP